MSKTDSFNQLKSLLDGKTIAKIEQPNIPDAICQFVLSDGSSFRLHATDLGFWIEHTAGTQGYLSLHSLMTDYGYHAYQLAPQYDFDLPAPTISVIGSGNAQLVIEAIDKKQFVMSVGNLSDKEMVIIGHPIGKELLARNAEWGDVWRMPFLNNSPECPIECRMTYNEVSEIYS